MAIHINSSELQSTVSEIIGYKSGLALSTDEMVDLLNDESSQLLKKFGWMRIYPEEIEQLIAELLYKVGNISNPSIAPFGAIMYHKYKNDENLFKMFMSISTLVFKFIEVESKAACTTSKSIDPTKVLKKIYNKFGLDGFNMAIEIFEGLNHQLHISPWTSITHCKYNKPIELRDLFESSSLEVDVGSFIDQRYIDYLHRDFESIDRIHWRKFEGLTAEFFDRQGFTVEIGPGSNDGGVDIRAWDAKNSKCANPTLIIQCKRTKSVVSKAIVKALWADVFHEGASSGLIVTTSKVTPGAMNDCAARKYPIAECNRQQIKQWVDKMKTPWRGVFMGE